jgi:CheY-like chemotaxis protein
VGSMRHEILIVDDEPQVRGLLREKMEHCGYRAGVAADGGEAIRMLSGGRFDLVISDIMMPESDGLELIMFLRKHRPNVKIIAMSAPGNRLFLNSALALGAARALEKPFRLDELVEAVETTLKAGPPTGAD